MRRLKLLTQCAAELSSAGAMPDAGGAAAAVRRFQAAVLGELPALAAEPGEAVRKHAAECALAHLFKALYGALSRDRVARHIKQ